MKVRLRESQRRRCDNWTILEFHWRDAGEKIPQQQKRGEEKERTKIIRHKTIYEEDLFLMRSRSTIDF